MLISVIRGKSTWGQLFIPQPFLPRIRQYRPAVRDCIMKFFDRAERGGGRADPCRYRVFLVRVSTRTSRPRGGSDAGWTANPNALRNRLRPVGRLHPG